MTDEAIDKDVLLLEEIRKAEEKDKEKLEKESTTE